MGRSRSRCSAMLRRVSEIWEDHQTAGALSGLVNVCAFLDEHTFLTKSGDLGVVFQVQGLDYECLDFPELDSFARRFEAALRTLTENFRLDQYLLKRRDPAIPNREYPHSEVVNRAIRERMDFLHGKAETLYSLELYFVVVYEGWHHHTTWRDSALKFLRDPLAALNGFLSGPATLAVLEA